MRKQKGFATLGVALMLMLLISMNSFVGTKNSALEQMSSNNAYYAEQSLQHAEMGLKQVTTNITQYLAANPAVTALSDIPANQTTLNLPNVYSTAMNGNQLVSTGYINGVGMRKIAQFLQITAGSSGAAALNALGSVDLGGSTSATSVKAGGSITGNLPAQGSANSNEFKVALLDHNDKILKDSFGNIIYRSMTSEEYFLYFFGGFCPIAKAAYDNGDLTAAAGCKSEVKAFVDASAKGQPHQFI